VEVRNIRDLIIALKFVVSKDIINLIIFYGSRVRLEEHIKVKFRVD